MRGILMGSAVFIIFLAIAIICLRWPYRIQEFALKYYERHTMAALFNPLLWVIKTPSCISWLRLAGITALIGSVLLLYALIFAVRKDLGW
jgi:hypothetical protein